MERVFLENRYHLNTLWDADRSGAETLAPRDSGESAVTFRGVVHASNTHPQRDALLETLSFLWPEASPPSLFSLDILEV